jgi:hypothetical protein
MVMRAPRGAAPPRRPRHAYATMVEDAVVALLLGGRTPRP